MSQAPEFKSKEELYFYWYLLELQEAGFIDDIAYEPSSFELCKPVRLRWLKQLKTKEKEMDYELLKGMSYTPDFSWRWSAMAIGVFVAGKNQNPKQMPFRSTDRKAWVDVKGTFTNRESFRIFPMHQKLMWDKFGIFVEKIVMPTLYVKTFTPERFLLTDKTFKPRTINFDTQTLKEYEHYQRQLLPASTGPPRQARDQQQPAEPI